MRILSWNVNGIRAVVKKLPGGLKPFFSKYNADIVCFQETKVDSVQALEREMIHIDGYESFWSFSKVKKGYSGVVTYSRIGQVVDAKDGMGGEDNDRFNEEGRIIMTDLGSIVLYNVYFPNGGSGETRAQYKMDFYKAFQHQCQEVVKKGKHVVIVGDVNTAHNPIDIHNGEKRLQDPKSGFLPQERQWMTDFFASGFVDTFRAFHPDDKQYSWWDPKNNARNDNKGWRIDYGIVNTELWKDVVSSEICKDQYGSDHCPILLELKTELKQVQKDSPIPPLSSRLLMKNSIMNMFKKASTKTDESSNSENTPIIIASGKEEEVPQKPKVIIKPNTIIPMDEIEEPVEKKAATIKKPSAPKKRAKSPEEVLSKKQKPTSTIDNFFKPKK